MLHSNGGLKESESLREKYSFDAIRLSNTLPQQTYKEVDGVFIILDSSVNINSFSFIDEIEQLVSNQVLSFINKDNKRIVIINPESDEIIPQVISNAPMYLRNNNNNKITWYLK